MLIEVKPFVKEGDVPKWGVFIDHVIFGVSKDSFDADSAAWRLQAMFENEKPEVWNHPPHRQFLMKQMEELRKAKKSTTRNCKLVVE